MVTLLGRAIVDNFGHFGGQKCTSPARFNCLGVKGHHYACADPGLSCHSQPGLLKVSVRGLFLGNVGILELKITGRGSGYFILRKKLGF